ncbi:iron ABC transporter permease component [Erysipelotrichaceae bacterium]|nr:iron ABC transporter permease component [Erysipelotrichaceae bacterium]
MFDYTFLLVLGSCIILSAASSMIGLVVVLQKESLVGDALAHAALPGVVIAFLLIGQKITLLLLLGAFISGIIAVILIYFIRKNVNLPFDGILAVILSSFFGFGMVLLTFSQKLPNAAQAGLKSFIFGQASAILLEDAYHILIVSTIVFSLFLLFWKEIKIYVFDPLFAQTLGFNNTVIQLLISSLMMVTIITQLQTVGIILTSSMLIAPGVAALQWTKDFKNAVMLAMVFGSVSATAGVIFSTIYANVPTGPAIIVVMSLFAIFSLIFGSRGTLQQHLKQKKFLISK